MMSCKDFNVSENYVAVTIEGHNEPFAVREDRPILVWGGDPPPTCDLLNSLVAEAWRVVLFAGQKLPKRTVWIMSNQGTWHKVSKVSWLGVAS